MTTVYQLIRELMIKCAYLDVANAELLEALKQIHDEFVLRDVGENDTLDEIAVKAIRKAEEQA